MEKEKKTTKTLAKTEPKSVKKVDQPKKVAPTKSKTVAKRVEKPTVKVESVKEIKPELAPAVAEVKKKTVTLNQELNLLIGLLSLVTIICFCFQFQGGDVEILGWELVVFGGKIFSGVFQGIMVLYVASLIIDCILAINVDTENEILNLIEKALYMFTIIINFIVVAVLLTLIKNVEIGLIVFFILSILSVVVKFARIYSQK